MSLVFPIIILRFFFAILASSFPPFLALTYLNYKFADDTQSVVKSKKY